MLHFARLLQAEERRVSNVVFMGMGEPFNNYDETLRACRLLNDPDGFGLAARGISVSTVGVVPAIERFAREPLQLNLAVSLHAGTDALRNRLVPLNKTYPLKELMAACRRYGIKVVLDMHSPPGGRYPNNDLAIFNEPLYQDHWVAMWERIARRYKGSASASRPWSP